MNTSSQSFSFTRQPLRLFALTALLAIGAAALQTAQAMPGGHGSHGGHDGPGGSMMSSPRQLDRMLDSVEATPEQRTQIRQIVSAAREAGRAQHEQGRALRDQGAKLFAQPTVDARAAEARGGKRVWADPWGEGV
jgi:periplasmic protein CpxP/Spy